MDAFCVPAEAIDQIWSQVEPYFIRALDRHDAEFELEDLKLYVTKGNWKLFAFVENDVVIGGAVVSFVVYPRSHVAFVTCIGGKGLIKPSNYAKFMQLLKDYGADRVQGYVTDSVARLYERVGVLRKTTMMEIVL